MIKRYLSIILFVLMGITSFSEEKVGLEVGNILKEFTVYSYPEGTPINSKEFRGKMTILNFSATWCPYCLEEKQNLEAFLKNNPELAKNINVVVVMLDTQKDIKKYMDKHKFTFPMYEDRNEKVANAFFIRGVPMSFILDENGKIVYRQIGLLDFEGTKSIFEKIEEE